MPILEIYNNSMYLQNQGIHYLGNPNSLFSLWFWQNFKISCVFPDRELFGPFSLFSLCSGNPVIDYSGLIKRQIIWLSNDMSNIKMG